MQSSRQLLVAAAAAAALIASIPPSFAAGLDTARIERLTGLKGTENAAEGVFKVTFPRKDIAASVAGVRLTPAMGLSAWAAFTAAGEHVMVMGDIVLQEQEIAPVMDAALGGGLEVTALHNHFAGEAPHIYFMHIGGSGSEEQMGQAVGKVFAALKKTIAQPPVRAAAEVDTRTGHVDGSALDAILGVAGTSADGVYKAVIGRKASMGGHDVGKEMGVNTWAAFAGRDELAVVDGDFAMREGEVQGVLKALRSGGIEVVAVHNHMIGESPRYVFLHYWGVGPARELARTLKAALDTQAHG